MAINSQQLLQSVTPLPGDKLSGDGLPENQSIAALRLNGQQRFDETGFPTQRDEDWKYTNLRALANKSFVFSNDNDAKDATDNTAELVSSDIDCFRLVFINGRFIADRSTLDNLPKGLVCQPISQALTEHSDAVTKHLGQIQPESPNSLANLNIGLFRDGAFITVADGVVVDKPIELIFVSQGEETISLPRNLIVLKQGAKLQVVERYRSEEGSTSFSNSVTEASLGDSAELDYYLVQTQSTKTSHIGAFWANQASNSRLSSYTISLGGKLTRNEFKTSLSGEDAHTDCFGLFVGAGRQHMDNHTTIRHAMPNCTSRQLYKGILDDYSRGVFHGRIIVERDAQLTAAEQQNPNLLLSRDAEIDTKPQLEIYADDVKCAHGATVGELDKKQLFYLQSRGINKADAKQLLTYAFAAEVIEAIKIDVLKEEIEHILAQKLISAEFADELSH